MSRLVQTRSARPRHAPLALASLMLLLALAAPADAALQAGPSAWLEYEEGQEEVQVVATEPHVDPGEQAACAGTVRLFFEGGAVRTLASAALGPGSCAAAALCAPYAGLPRVTGCDINPLACCTPLHRPGQVWGDITALTLGCLRVAWLHVDVDGDGAPDDTTGPIPVFDACSR